MAQDIVILLDFWPSSYEMRVKIALAEKDITYECKQEDLNSKSSLLLEKNSVHKIIPVLIHNGKPICESLNIVQYIDEVWNQKPNLLPSDPYQLSQARFWGDYIDKNRVWTEKGKSEKKFIECLKTLEEELGNKPYFGGEHFGYVDLALVAFTSWFYIVECPKLMAWARRCMAKESVVKALPHPHEIYDFALRYKQRHGLD